MDERSASRSLERVTAEQKLALTEAVWTCRDRMSGVPCFRGTRVPVQSLIDFLEVGKTIDQFLELYPSVTRKQLIAVLNLANRQIIECASSLTNA